LRTAITTTRPSHIYIVGKIDKHPFGSIKELKMSKVEYTEANREKLATAVVENMDLSDMVQALYEQELECYERCEDTFQELWHNYYGINLMVGDEVYWNDPDEDTCSGLGIFVRYLDDGAAVIRKDDVEIEVFVKELS
tara:strand:+ start:1337 stop:1750 length:414 start_codon:yes stop_codon:yes gene_type:complete